MNARLQVTGSSLLLVCLVLAPPTGWTQNRSAAVEAAIDELVAANHVLAREGILPEYGHVSIRHPENPQHYFLARSMFPEMVTAADILELDLDSNPVDSGGRSYSERFIHGEIYRARPDVQAIVHNHSPTVITFGIGTTPLRPVFHQAAWFLDSLPIWDYRELGTSEVLVDSSARGAALAAALGDRPAVLMRNHGVAVVASSLPDVVVRSIVLEQNARMQAELLGREEKIIYLDLDEEGPGSGSERIWALYKYRLYRDAR